MRIFQRDGTTVRFQWVEKDRAIWEAVLESIRGLPGRVWIPTGKYWEAPWNQRACQVIRDAGFIPGEIKVTASRNLEAEAKAKEEVRKERERTKRSRILEILRAPWTPPWSKEEVDASRLPGRREYQIDSMRFLQWRKGRGLIGDDMGTGKSCQALSWLELHPELRPAIIVSTTSTKYQWLTQQRLWMSKDASPIEILSGQTPHTWMPLTPNRIYVINWEILSFWADWLSRINPKCIVGDEIQAIGNPTALRTKAFTKLAAPIERHVIAMSGTPITSRPEQFWPVLHLLDPQEFSNHNSFKWRYCNMKKTAFGMDSSGASNVEELHLKLRNCMIRRTKADVMPELPEKMRTPVMLPVSKDAEYEAMEEKILGLQGISVREMREQLSALSRSAFALKRKAVLDWIGDFLNSNEKLLVFAWHKLVVEALMMHLGQQCITISGDTKVSDRPGLVDRFQNDPKCRVCVANIVAGGTGIDGLQNVCSNSAFVELTTVPAQVMQAEDRLHRMGQRTSTGIWYLLGSGTVDEDILEVCEERRATVTTLLDGTPVEEQDDSKMVLERMKRRRGLL